GEVDRRRGLPFARERGGDDDDLRRARRGEEERRAEGAIGLGDRRAAVDVRQQVDAVLIERRLHRAELAGAAVAVAVTVAVAATDRRRRGDDTERGELRHALELLGSLDRAVHILEEEDRRQAEDHAE